MPIELTEEVTIICAASHRLLKLTPFALRVCRYACASIVGIYSVSPA